ncbi:MAG TPA: mechanosensitive ion channel domain-containing protein [Mycobacteriales bacterium]
MDKHQLFGLTDRQWADFVTTPARIVLIVVIALVLRFLVGRAIRRFVSSTRDGRMSRRLLHLGERAPLLVDTSPAAVDRRRQRAETLGTVLRSLTNLVILVVAAMMILGEVGINLAPLIASAGIVGVALGFGAQNLVKDFLSGMFLVIEDTYGVGDWVDLGPASGTVEWIGLRSTRIRDVTGTLWSIRNGEINAVGNYSQAWQRAIFDIPVLHGQDLDLAKATMLAAAEEVAAANEDIVLEPPAVWGVNEIRPEGVVMRLVVKRRNNNAGFDRSVREAIVAHLDAVDVRIFTLPAAVDLHLGTRTVKADLDLGRAEPRTLRRPVPPTAPDPVANAAASKPSSSARPAKKAAVRKAIRRRPRS